MRIAVDVWRRTRSPSTWSNLIERAYTTVYVENIEYPIAGLIEHRVEVSVQRAIIGTAKRRIHAIQKIADAHIEEV